jgi:PAS domain-containing protein
MIERLARSDPDRSALEAAWEHQERLFNLIAQAAVGIAQTDLQERFLLVNDCYCEIVGRDRETLLEQRILDIAIRWTPRRARSSCSNWSRPASLSPPRSVI